MYTLHQQTISATVEKLTGRPLGLPLMFQHLVRQMLEDEPFEIVAAADGQEALEKVAQQRPDIILLDLVMPRLDGFEVLEYVQNI